MESVINTISGKLLFLSVITCVAVPCGVVVAAISIGGLHVLQGPDVVSFYGQLAICTGVISTPLAVCVMCVFCRGRLLAQVWVFAACQWLLALIITLIGAMFVSFG